MDPFDDREAAETGGIEKRFRFWDPATRSNCLQATSQPQLIPFGSTLRNQLIDPMCPQELGLATHQIGQPCSGELVDRHITGDVELTRTLIGVVTAPVLGIGAQPGTLG